jgi:hypothetical protein
MQEVAMNERPIIGYAQPLSRLQVSWGSILAGAVSALAVALILWTLALAIIWSAMAPSVSSVENGIRAAWITAMVSILVGAFVGGAVAGYLPGNPRRFITRAHGFLAWCAAFLLASMVQFSILGGAVRTATGALVATATTAVQTTGAAVGGAVSGQTDLARKATSLLTSLGYSTSEAGQIVGSAQADLQRALRGAQPTQGAAQAAETARGALDTIFRAAAVYTWLWFATWAIAAAASVLGASWVIKRVRLVPQRELVRDDRETRPPSPLHPAHEAR